MLRVLHRSNNSLWTNVKFNHIQIRSYNKVTLGLVNLGFFSMNVTTFLYLLKYIKLFIVILYNHKNVYLFVVLI